MKLLQLIQEIRVYDDELESLLEHYFDIYEIVDMLDLNDEFENGDMQDNLAFDLMKLDGVVPQDMDRITMLNDDSLNDANIEAHAKAKELMFQYGEKIFQ